KERWCPLRLAPSYEARNRGDSLGGPRSTMGERQQAGHYLLPAPRPLGLASGAETPVNVA
ncbi:MAG TPA: hypothetical protein VIV15_07665, partial [Anaerolineales bacterium]